MATAQPDAQRLAEENGRTLEALLARLQSLNVRETGGCTGSFLLQKKISEVPSSARSSTLHPFANRI